MSIQTNSRILAATVILIATALLCWSGGALGGDPSFEPFDALADVGAVKHAGVVSYHDESQSFTISGSGTNMWFGEDEFAFLHTRLEGDFIVRARLSFVGEGVDPHRKIGWMVRENLEPDSPYVDAVVHGDGLTSLQYRPKKGEDTGQIEASITHADVIQLERTGDTYTVSVARFGEPFVVVGSRTQVLGQQPFVGLFVCSHNPDVIEQAVFSNVRVVKPAWPGLVQYTDYLGSNLEIMEVASGQRRILHREARSLQAPNWTHDGKTLVYNAEGLLYRYELETGEVSVLNTGFADSNNNDHVLSWDGKHIAISHHNADDDGLSTIYTLPLGGSDTPRQITPSGVGASYLHGYSPDDKELTYTANRNGQWNIFKIGIADRKEIQLTENATLDDGSEFSPDGRHIYFNSNRTGTMQLWRMKADGSDEEQVTFDEFHDWFPHVSPDGQTLVFLSYRPGDVESSQHPFYKNVYLRAMPVSGGAPRVIAYLYGGQGTINVPSWSPDGKHIAFVSNSVIEQ